MKTKKKNKVLEQVKAMRKQSREEEIKTHGKPINYKKIIASKKLYKRKNKKADTNEGLPYLFYKKLGFYQILTLFSGFKYIGSVALIPNASYHA